MPLGCVSTDVVLVQGTSYPPGLANAPSQGMPNPEAQPQNYVMKATQNFVYMTTKELSNYTQKVSFAHQNLDLNCHWVMATDLQHCTISANTRIVSRILN